MLRQGLSTCISSAAFVGSPGVKVSLCSNVFFTIGTVVVMLLLVMATAAILEESEFRW